MFTLKHPLVLGSQSPRRKQILADAGFVFTCLSPDVDESVPDGLLGAEIPVFLAKKKALRILEMTERPSIVVTSDTIVWHLGKALNKPESDAEAVEMLKTLSGSTHEVHTGVCVTDGERFVEFSDRTEVVFENLSLEMIVHYVEKFKPLDKAGAYGIQEWIGLVGVKKINGSFYNVMGLPIHRVFAELMKFCQ